MREWERIAWLGGLLVIGASLAGCATDIATTSATHSISTQTAMPPTVSKAPRPVAAVTAQAPAVVTAHAGTALAALAKLPVHPAGSMVGYSREAFGTAWSDDNDDPDGHNGCDTRNDILRRDLTHVTIETGTAGCVVLTGTLHEPYGGSTISFVRGPESSIVQIDHVVALGNAWTTGAARLSGQQRIDLSEDPLELLAVSGRLNDEKGDSDASGWLPPNRADDCPYVATQVAVKAKWHLWITSAERAAMLRVLDTCPSLALPGERTTPLAPNAVTVAPAPAPATAPVRSVVPVAPTTSHAAPTVYVHPGAFCAPKGAHGVTDEGTPMICGPTPNSPTRNRWHAA